MQDIPETLVRNYTTEQGFHRGLPPHLVFWDETLRDGEQTPGVSYSAEEKLTLAKILDDMGVGIINAGIPVVSPEEERAVKKLAQEGFRASILAAARTVRKDVDAVIDCDVDEIAIFVPSSDLHLKYKLKMTREQVLEISVREVEYAKDHGLVVSFVTEDTVRADLDYVEKLYNACIEAGASRAVLCDTVGVATPIMMRWFVEEVKKRFKPVQLSIHCHNDFGMAVANTIAAIEAGVEVPHTCVNGLGERSGNTSFEELVTILETLYQHNTGIKLQRLFELSKQVEELSGVPLGVNKPIVGYNAFSHESGIHAHGVLQNTLTYEPIQPETVGRTRRFIFGKHTGASAVVDKLEHAGILDLPREQILDIVNKIKAKAEHRDKRDLEAFVRMYREREDKGLGVTGEEFWEIIRSLGVKIPEGK